MKTNPSRFAFLGIVLSGLAVVVLVVILVVSGLSSSGIVQLPDPQIINRSIAVCIGIFILGLALTAFLDPERTRKFLVGRQIQYGSNAVIMLLAFFGILLFLNILAYQNPKSWDLTEGQQNTLAPETIALLKTMQQPISARAYFSTRTDPTQTKKLLEDFKVSAPGKFTYEFIDPDTNPVAAQQDGVSVDGTVVLLLADRKEQVSLPDEVGLDSAVIRLTNPEQRMVYFTTGHGEADITQTDDTAYSLIKTVLENKNYTVNTLNLASQTNVPQDAKVVIIAGPQTPLSTDEETRLQAYLDKGGAVIVMENPRQLTKFGDAPDPIATMLSASGITLQNDIVFDPNANPPLLVYADPLNYAQHPITDKLRGVNSRFFTSQSLKLASPQQGITLTPLAKTYSDAWGETDLASIENNQVSFDSTKDHPGPLVLAASAENTTTKGRLVVFGDSEFASNALYKLGNGDIFVNAVDWAAGQENLINITPKNNITREFNPPGSFGLISIIIVSLCLLPLLIIGSGIATWFARRKRG